MSLFDKYFEELIGVEGKYSNHPHDRGGETMFGITKAVARENNYTGEMKNMPLSYAKKIYYAEYWQKLGLHYIAGMSPIVAKELFDTGVNQGTGKAARYLQECLNVFNKQGTIYRDLNVDGDIGEKTIAAFRKYIDHRGEQGETVMYRALNSLQGAFYIKIAQGRENESFVYGWFLNRVS